MRTIGLREVKLGEIRKPGNWLEILDSPEVEAKARSIAGIGLIHEPVVRFSDKRIVCGRRRIAAKEKLRAKTMMVKMVECSDHELEVWSAAENAERSHSVQDQMAAVAELMRLLSKEKLEADPGLRITGPGRSKSAHGIARAEVAEALGLKVKTIAQREYRNRVKNARPQQLRDENIPAPDADSTFPEDDPILSPWVELEDVFKKKVRRVQRAVDDVDEHLIQALGMLTKIKSQGLPCHVDRIDRIHEDLAFLGAAVRGLRPTSLCPWCKGVDEIQATCTACRASGYITKAQEEGVPKELMAITDPIVICLGQQKKLSEFFPVETPEIEYNENPFGLPDD